MSSIVRTRQCATSVVRYVSCDELVAASVQQYTAYAECHAATVRGVFAVTLVSCVDELLVSITAARRIYRLAVRAPVCSLLVFIFSGARSRSSRMQGVRSSCCSGVHCSARNAYIRAASAPRRRVCAAKTRPEVPPKTTPCRPATARPALPINETRGCACFGPKATSLAQGPAAGRAGASRRETPATAAHRPFAALPKHARLGASAFTRGSPISTTPSFERQASSEGARPRCDSAQRAAFPAPAAPQRCCACFF